MKLEKSTNSAIVTQRQAIKQNKNILIASRKVESSVQCYTNSFSPHRDLNYVQSFHPFFSHRKLVRSSYILKHICKSIILHNNLRRDDSRRQLDFIYVIHKSLNLVAQNKLRKLNEFLFLLW